MDLSKAFDCLPHDLIIEKLTAYGISDSSCRLMASYLSNRTQRFKKDDPLIPKNYRPVSILPTLSNIHERLLGNQLTAHFNYIFQSYLSAFRTSYGCQTTLLRIVEDLKEALDKNMFVGAILMDLSKAFDCLPHDLIIEKLKVYVVSDSSCRLMASYLSNRTQTGKNWEGG